MIFHEETLNKTEIPRILEFFVRHAISDVGVDHIHRLAPARDVSELVKRHKQVREMVDFRATYGEKLPLKGLSPIKEILREGQNSSYISGEDLYKISRLMISANKIRIIFEPAKENFPLLWSLSRKIKDLSAQIQALSVVNPDGTLLDSASSRLSELRYETGMAKREMRGFANRLFQENRFSGSFQDRNLHIRNGRYVLALKIESSSSFPGIIQDRSATGNTLYMEHENMVRINNRLSLLRSEERDEMERIYRELTQRVLKRRRALNDAEEAVAAFDFLLALGEVLDSKHWNLPCISQRQEFRLDKAWHPLLKVAPVPLDISCGKAFHVLVITGPNTGGKTVALKTVAICVILGWLGLPIPADESSVIGKFSSVFIDVGDEQSVEQNLSTFSAHIIRIIEMLQRSSEESLLLIDEMGSGTDPQEGAALGIAILDLLRERRIVTVATTHHNPIKRFALASSGIETASMEFDELTLTPTFRLIMGAPGKSNALIIAERLGMPAIVIDRARSQLENKGTSTSDLIEELHDTQIAAEKRHKEILSLKSALKEKEVALIKEHETIKEEKSRIIAEAREEAEEILSDTRKRTRALLKQLDGAALSAAHRVIAKERDILGKKDSGNELMRRKSGSKGRNDLQNKELSKGATVRIDDGKVLGTVISINEGKAILQVGQMRMEIARDRLTPVDKPANDRKKAEDRPPHLQRPSNIPPSLMIRGMTTDEGIPLVERYLDQAMRAGYSSVIIIHGRGQGILRREVYDICKRLPYVSDFRLGSPDEGGHGVTVVSFRS